MRRKYKFTDKSHSRKGILSSLLGAAALLLTAAALAIAYGNTGQAGKFIAVMGFLALLVSLAGLYQGVLGLREEDSYRLFPRLGFTLNGLTVAAYVMIYITGW